MRHRKCERPPPGSSTPPVAAAAFREIVERLLRERGEWGISSGSSRLASPKLRAFRSRFLYRALILSQQSAAGSHCPWVVPSVGSSVGLAWHLVPRERNKALRNIGLAFPEWDEQKRQDTIRAMFRHFGMSLFEIAWLWNMDLATRDRTTSFEGAAPMLKLIDEKRGVVLFTAHVGNWEWLSIVMGLFSRPTSVLQRERDSPEMGRYITEFRARVGVRRSIAAQRPPRAR